MTEQSVSQKAEQIPFEIRRAIEGFDSEREQAIVVTLIDEGPLSFSELQAELGDLHNQKLTNALKKLRQGALVRKRATDAMESKYDAYYEVSEYGERFVDCLLESLGSVDSFDEAAPEYESVDHLRRGGEAVLVESYRQSAQATSSQPQP
jgi:DNA-binding HxlR family transcriptional regulator